MAKKRPELDILGSTGVWRGGGYVDDEQHPKLRGRRAMHWYRQMRDNDPIVGAMLYGIRSLITQADWRIEPAGPDTASNDAAEFMSGVLNDMSHTFEDAMSDILTMLEFGWSWMEVVYKIRGGNVDDSTKRSRFNDQRIGWRKLSLRPQWTLFHWDVDDDGGIQGLWQVAPPTWRATLIPVQKSLHFRTNAAGGNPEGRSLLRNAFRPWFLKSRMENIEGIGVERDLAGLPDMQVPPALMDPNASASDKALRAELEQLVQQIRRDEREGILVPAETDEDGNPTGYKLSLLSSGGRRQLDTNAIITRHEQRIAMVALAEFLMLGMTDTGTYALATTKQTLFGKALNATMDQVASVINRHGIPRLMMLNGIPEDAWPTLEHGEVAAAALDELGKYISELVVAGAIVPDPTLERELRARAKLPEPEEDQ